MKYHYIPIFVSLIFASPVHAAVYKCVVKGQTVYSDKVCSTDAEEVKLTITKTDSNSNSVEQTSNDIVIEQNIQSDENRLEALQDESQQIKAEISKLEKEIKDSAFDSSSDLSQSSETYTESIDKLADLKSKSESIDTEISQLQQTISSKKTEQAKQDSQSYQTENQFDSVIGGGASNIPQTEQSESVSLPTESSTPVEVVTPIQPYVSNPALTRIEQLRDKNQYLESNIYQLTNQYQTMSTTENASEDVRQMETEINQIGIEIQQNQGIISEFEN